MLDNNILTIYREDADFKKVKGINVINPFEQVQTSA